MDAKAGSGLLGVESIPGLAPTRAEPRFRRRGGSVEAADRTASETSSSRTPSADAEDLALMQRFQRGEVAAYELLVARHLDEVHRLALRFVPDDASADDIAQEVFLRLYRSADRFREPKNFRGWLRTMTSRIALNELRTRRRKRWRGVNTDDRPIDAAAWRPGSDGEATPEESTLARERAALVHRAIDALPDRQRVAITLQRFEGWDLEQIGEAMDLSVSAVKSLLHRSREKLAEFLAPLLDDAEERERP